MVKYYYDAWGNHTILDEFGNDIPDGNTIGWLSFLGGLYDWQLSQKFNPNGYMFGY